MAFIILFDTKQPSLKKRPTDLVKSTNYTFIKSGFHQCLLLFNNLFSFFFYKITIVQFMLYPQWLLHRFVHVGNAYLIVS